VHKYHKTHHSRDSLETPEKAVNMYPVETWIYALISAGLVGLSGIFPLVVIPLDAEKLLEEGGPAAARLRLLLSFAVGGLLGDVFLHLLPEAWINLHPGDHQGFINLGLWVLCGILTFLVIEKIFPDPSAEEEDDKASTSSVEHSAITSSNNHDVNKNVAKNGTEAYKRNKQTNGHAVANGNGHVSSNGHVSCAEPEPEVTTERIKTSGWLNLLANIIDNFTHGLAVAASYCVSTKCGLLTTVIVLLHEIPHEVGDFAILLRSGFDRWKAAKCQILTASGGVLGALTALLAESTQEAGNATAWLLPFSAGGFLYVSMVTILPDLVKETNPRESIKQLLCIGLGVSVMTIVATCLDEHDLPNIT